MGTHGCYLIPVPKTIWFNAAATSPPELPWMPCRQSLAGEAAAQVTQHVACGGLRVSGHFLPT